MALPGYVGGLDTTPEEDARAAALSPSLESDVSGVLFTGGTLGSLTEKVKEFGALEIGRRLPGAASPYMTAEEANREYGIDGQLSFSEPVTSRDAAYKYKAKRDELWRTSVLERNDSVGGAASLGYSVVGGIVDPASLALNFVPIAGEARWGKVVADAGLKAKLARGAWAGAQGGVLQESLTYGLSQAEGRDYTAEDAAMGVLSSTLFGTGFEGLGHVVGGAVGGKGRALSPTEQTVSSALAAQGLPDHVIRGVLAGSHAESRLDPNIVNPTSGAYGIGQWLGPRKRELFKRYGDKPTLEQQAEFLAWELKGGDHGGAKVLAAKDAGEALNSYINDFMRPAKGAETTGDLARGAQYLGDEIDLGVSAEPRVHVPGLEPEAARAPDLVTAMDMIDQHGTLAAAIDQFAEHGRVDVGDLIANARPRASAALDEATADLQISGRLIDRTETVAVNGEALPVQYALVEAGELKTSHDPDGVRNADYPDEMQVQPRDLGHFNRELAADMDVTASPVIGPDGTVEGFNAQVLKVIKAYRDQTPRAGAYRAHLAEQGYDTKGMANPVLVRVRTEAKSGSERVRIARGLVQRPQLELPLDAPAQGMPKADAYGGAAAVAKWRAIQAGPDVAPEPASVALPKVEEAAPSGAPLPSKDGPATSPDTSGEEDLLGGMTSDDPELKALSAEVEKLREDMPEAFADVPAFDQPAKLVKAIAAYSQCLIKGAVS